MKRFSYLLFTLIPALLLTGCKYDDDNLWNKINDHEERITTLEAKIESLNSDISNLQTLVDALQEQDYIRSVVHNPDGSYAITFGKGNTITIKDGKDGANGQNGRNGANAPVIGIAVFESVYYWTITTDGNTDWLVGDDGKKLRVTGENGKDGLNGQDGQNGVNGITPVMGVDSDGYWTVDTGNGAVRITDSNGNPVNAAGKDGTDGDDGDSIFSAIDNTDNDYVIFTLADNITTIVVPKVISSLIAFDSYELFYASLTSNEIAIVLSSMLKENDYTAISATITDNNGMARDIQTRAGSGDAWRVVVTRPTFTNGTLDAGSAKVIFTAPENIKLSETAILTVTLTDSHGKDHSVSRPVKYFDGEIVESTAGNLNSVITNTSVTSLAIQGSMNATDFTYIKSTLTAIEVLDISMTDLTEIPDNALDYYGTGDGSTINTTLKKVAFPSTLVTIGECAFRDCHALSSVDTENVKEIKQRAFQSCSKLTEVKLGNTLETIGNNVFRNCISLPYIEIPRSVQTLGRWVFYNCGRLETVVLNEGLQNFSQSTFYGSGIVFISIPTTVTQIPEWAFQDCERLERITLHDDITYIGEAAFLRCKSLKSIKIPIGVTELSQAIFQSCTDLKYVTFHNGITAIGNEAFAYCSNLDESLILPDGLMTLGLFAFGNCKSLVFVCIPGSLVTIQGQAFSGCSNLSAVELFDGLKEIGEGAFQETALGRIELPKTVTSLGNMAFYACKELTAVVSYATIAPTITPMTFDSNYKTGRKLIYPASADYSSWATYFNTMTTMP